METQTLGFRDLREAKTLGLIEANVTKLHIIPRDTIKALVKIVNSSEAWAAFNYLWDVGEKPSVAAEQQVLSLQTPVQRHIQAKLSPSP